jgi:hypothetical protein
MKRSSNFFARVAFKLVLLAIFIATAGIAFDSLVPRLTWQPLPREWRIPETQRSPFARVRLYRV